MKRTLVFLGAACAAGAAVLAPPASSAPPTEAKVSIRANVDRQCVATVHVSWVRFDPLNTVYVDVYRSGSGEYAEYAPTATAAKDKFTVTFVGEPQTERVATVFHAYLNGAEAMDEVTKTVACDHWSVLP